MPGSEPSTKHQLQNHNNIKRTSEKDVFSSPYFSAQSAKLHNGFLIAPFPQANATTIDALKKHPVPHKTTASKFTLFHSKESLAAVPPQLSAIASVNFATATATTVSTNTTEEFAIGNGTSPSQLPSAVLVRRRTIQDFAISRPTPPYNIGSSVKRRTTGASLTSLKGNKKNSLLSLFSPDPSASSSHKRVVNPGSLATVVSSVGASGRHIYITEITKSGKSVGDLLSLAADTSSSSLVPVLDCGLEDAIISGQVESNMTDFVADTNEAVPVAGNKIVVANDVEYRVSKQRESKVWTAFENLFHKKKNTGFFA
ncbi:hypothetical protein HK100_008002 [Physocladia obscura]|uniref:Uncharacterized protein n=1 Tax=Physocladia obscura TaxID=109957 RepID=A0AAD5XJV3_9FUNG|nr:hypothetical protein HK100_008002 [Physocladia obscura]